MTLVSFDSCNRGNFCTGTYDKIWMENQTQLYSNYGDIVHPKGPNIFRKNKQIFVGFNLVLVAVHKRFTRSMEVG